MKWFKKNSKGLVVLGLIAGWVIYRTFFCP